MTPGLCQVTVTEELVKLDFVMFFGALVTG
jgi:hypothetical protein